MVRRKRAGQIQDNTRKAQDKKTAELTSKYEIQGVPTTMLIDSSGKVLQRKVGYIGPREMLADLRQVD